MNPETPPARNEVEVSVFGPGYGECIVVHIGGGDWIVVDSCVRADTREAVAIDYLYSIGVNPSQAVKLIVATHWHDDHVRGLAETVRECGSAAFACSDALNTREFLTLVKALARRPMAVQGSGVQEFDGVVRVLEERSRDVASPGRGPIGPIWALADRLLWRRREEELRSGPKVEVHSLSPSDASNLAAKLDLQSLWPAERCPKRRVMGIGPNRASVALWVVVGEQKILLGADLEETMGSHRGWTVILDSVTRPPGVATAFKVPHHGSSNGDEPRVWRELLGDEPTVVLTPFRLGGRKLPEEADVRRINGRTSRAYITASPEVPERRRSPGVRRILRGSARSIRPVDGPMGHVRLRAADAVTGAWRVELFGSARSLRELAA